MKKLTLIDKIVNIVMIALFMAPLVMIKLMVFMMIGIIPAIVFIIVPTMAKVCILIAIYILSIMLVQMKRV